MIQEIPAGYASLEDKVLDLEKLNAFQRRKVSKALAKVLKPIYFHGGVPMDEIKDAFRKIGMIVVMEDNTEWSGFFAGREGSAIIRFAISDSKYTNIHGEFYTPVKNAAIAIQWYKMASGKYEINGYIS